MQFILMDINENYLIPLCMKFTKLTIALFLATIFGDNDIFLFTSGEERMDGEADSWTMSI